jgi:hypothetical protein
LTSLSFVLLFKAADLQIQANFDENIENVLKGEILRSEQSKLFSNWKPHLQTIKITKKRSKYAKFAFAALVTQ